MSSTTLLQFKQQFSALETPSLSAGMVSVELKLSNVWANHTLNDLRNLVAQFGVPGKHLHLSTVKDGCIAVFWWCSTSHVKELKVAILKAADLLQTVGLLQAFIGKELIVECSQPDDPHMVESVLEHSSHKNWAKICLLQNTGTA